MWPGYAGQTKRKLLAGWMSRLDPLSEMSLALEQQVTQALCGLTSHCGIPTNITTDFPVCAVLCVCVF